MQKRNLLSLFFLCFLACKNSGQDNQAKQEKFDKIKWATKEGPDYPYRDKILNDLISNYELHGTKKDSLVHLLGSPD